MSVHSAGKSSGYFNCESEIMWHVAKYSDPYSEFMLCIWLIQSAHTHREKTHTQNSGQPFMLRRPGSSWGFGALLKGTSVVVLRALYIDSPSLQLLPDLRLEVFTGPKIRIRTRREP